MAQLTLEEISEHVSSVLLPLSKKLNLDIVELKIGLHLGDIIIQVFADRPEGGIDIDDCTHLNKGLVEALDTAAVLPLDNFTVEVASPGLDRPLKTSKDFLRNLNYNIRLFLVERVAGKKEALGQLIAATKTDVTVFTKKKQELVIPLSNIEYGILVF